MGKGTDFGPRAGMLWMLLVVTTSTAITVRAEPLPPLAAPSSTEDPPVPAINSRQPFLGSQSCAATSCHGEPDRSRFLASAYHVFLDRDPHAQAGLLLYHEQSRAIVERLGYEQPAWQAQQCTSCHAPGALHVDSGADTSRWLSDGVGCESCHGAASSWVSSHRSLQWHDPDEWPAERKLAAGFVNTKDLTTRVGVCADCHIGNADQQVTHDLIAAGHPRLIYEFSAYHAMLAPHWDRAADRERLRTAAEGDAGLAITSWLLGQLVTADHHLAQIHSAASDPSSAFPDLAHYDCYACHHNLTDPSWRQSRSAGHVKPGQIEWGTWTLGLIFAMPDGFAGVESDQISSDLLELRELLQRFSDDRRRVAALAGQVGVQIAESMERVSSVSLDQADRHRLTISLLGHGASRSGQWDRSAHLFLAVAALQHDTGRVFFDRAELLDQIRRQLAFEIRPAGTTAAATIDSPRLDRDAAGMTARERVDQFYEQYLRRLTSGTRTGAESRRLDHPRIETTDPF